MVIHATAASSFNRKRDIALVPYFSEREIKAAVLRILPAGSDRAEVLAWPMAGHRYDRVMPHERELRVLSTVVARDDEAWRIARILGLSATNFDTSAHSLLFDLILKLRSEGKAGPESVAASLAYSPAADLRVAAWRRVEPLPPMKESE